MKKIICVLLTFVLCATSVTAFAKTPLLDATQVMMGDANNDSKVNAADARIVLRIAAKIQAADSVNLFSIDADGNGQINASDARILLRVSAGISNFVYGFDGNGVPCALNVLRSSKYYLEATYTDGTSTDSISITLVRNKENVYLMSDDMGFDMGELGFSECGMMIAENKIYAILGNDEIKAAMYIPDSLSEEMGMTKEEIFEVSDMIATFIPDDIGTATKKVLNNEEVLCYTYELMDGTYCLCVRENGEIISINDESGNKSTPLVIFDKISADSTDKYFDLDNYQLI